MTTARSTPRPAAALAATAALLLAAGAVVSPPAAAQEWRGEAIRAVGALPADHTSTAAMDRFAREILDTTMGRLEVDLQPGIVGGTEAALDLLRSGQATLAWVELTDLEPLVPAFGVVSLPFLFEDRERMFELLARPGLGRLLDLELQRHRVRALGHMDGGALRLVSGAAADGPIATAEDLRGRRIGVRPGEARSIAFETVGAEPVPLERVSGGGAPYAAPPPAGVELWEATYPDLLADPGIDPAQLSVAETPHTYEVIVVLAGTEAFERLPPEFQEIIPTTMGSAVLWQRGVAAAADATARERLVERGARSAPVPAELHQELRSAVIPVVRGRAERVGAPIVDAVLAYIEEE